MKSQELREYVHRRGWEIVGDYVDVGISSSKEFRPELNRLMADAHKRHFDSVVVQKTEMAMGLSHTFETRSRKKCLQDRPVYGEESKRISIMARSH